MYPTEIRSDDMAGKRKGTYKITNWREYNDSLVRRGDIAFWFDEDVLDAWQHANDEPKVGRPFIYSNTATARMDCGTRWAVIGIPKRGVR